MVWASNGLLLVGQVTTPSAENADENGVIDPFRISDPPPGRLLVYSGDSPGTMELIGSAEVGVFPLTMMSSPDGGQVFVSAIASSVLNIFDLSDPTRPRQINAIELPVKIAAGTHGLAYVPSRTHTTK